MTIDITPEAVERTINDLWERMPPSLARKNENMINALSAANEDAYLRGFAAGQVALKNAGEFVVIDSPELAELRAALTASQAETAAAYEVAIAAVRQADASYEGAPGAYANIRALTPSDSKAALDRMIAEARTEGRNDGMREAAAIADSCAKTARDALVKAEGIGERMAWQAAITRAEMIRDSILAAIPADSKAALDRMIADAEVRGMRKALDAASDYTQRVYGDDWKFMSNPIDRDRILAAIQKGGE